VLTHHAKRGNRWDPEEFFGLGKAEIAGVLGWVSERGLPLSHGRALDSA
jgi:hypothetical protein